MASSDMVTVMVPPSAWITILISPSYMAIAVFRIAALSTPSIFRRFFTALLASPARVKSLPSMS